MQTRLGDLKILLVDDEEFVRAIMRRMLHSFGIQVIEEAGDGQAALELMQTFLPDLAFVDLSMEPMDGRELLRSMRTHVRPDLRNVPVFILTLNSDADMIKQVVPMGVEGYLVKPVAPDALRAKILQAVGIEGVVK
ncbi:MAG: response regulator [Alphaproteobacteria bacterium]|nr:response regulator [Alphaproteobacteria bacterium]